MQALVSNSRQESSYMFVSFRTVTRTGVSCGRVLGIVAVPFAPCCEACLSSASGAHSAARRPAATPGDPQPHLGLELASRRRSHASLSPRRGGSSHPPLARSPWQHGRFPPSPPPALRPAGWVALSSPALGLPPCRRPPASGHAPTRQAQPRRSLGRGGGSGGRR